MAFYSWLPTLACASDAAAAAGAAAAAVRPVWHATNYICISIAK